MGRTRLKVLPTIRLIGEMIGDQTGDSPQTTARQSPKMGRITQPCCKMALCFKDLGIDGNHRETDRGMVCGRDWEFQQGVSRKCLEGFGLRKGANSDPNTMSLEKAFVGLIRL